MSEVSHLTLDKKKFISVFSVLEPNTLITPKKKKKNTLNLI